MNIVSPEDPIQGFFVLGTTYNYVGTRILVDKKYMKRVFELARQGIGATSPNPLVGTVIVKNNQIIGEGYHQKFGDKHAEIMAMDKAEASCEGATLYCNLEPCTNDIPNKKTPPCTRRIIKEKIQRVVVSTIDPNPYINGRGLAILRKENIDVHTDILAQEAIQLNEKYYKFIKSSLPFIHLKIAQSLDGRIATASGSSQWITNVNALKMVHQLRAEYDAVLIGINTVIQDNPALTVRHARGRNPMRIILDEKLQIPDNAKLICDENIEKTIIFTNQNPDIRRIKALSAKGIRIFKVGTSANGELILPDILKQLAELQIASVLVEGGGQIFTSFVKHGLFDKISFFIAPIMIGSGIQSIGNLGIENLSQAYQLENISFEILDNQAIVEGYRDFKSIAP
jgi:diaminohydroxyphosphoribosylaminopyrimidine deaminase/5-amino-6-(5-phosphoribosylamino)uracil reductase